VVEDSSLIRAIENAKPIVPGMNVNGSEGRRLSENADSDPEKPTFLQDD